MITEGQEPCIDRGGLLMEEVSAMIGGGGVRTGSSLDDDRPRARPPASLRRPIAMATTGRIGPGGRGLSDPRWRGRTRRTFHHAQSDQSPNTRLPPWTEWPRADGDARRAGPGASGEGGLGDARPRRGSSRRIIIKLAPVPELRLPRGRLSATGGGWAEGAGPVGPELEVPAILIGGPGVRSGSLS